MQIGCRSDAGWRMLLYIIPGTLTHLCCCGVTYIQRHVQIRLTRRRVKYCCCTWYSQVESMFFAVVPGTWYEYS